MDILLGLALSKHINFQNDYNEIHPHIRFQENFFIGGAYYNSVENISPYAGFRFEHNGLGLELGVAGGYPAFGIAVPYARGTYDLNDNIILFVAPSGEVDGNTTNIGIVAGVELLAFEINSYMGTLLRGRFHERIKGKRVRCRTLESS